MRSRSSGWFKVYQRESKRSKISEWLREYFSQEGKLSNFIMNMITIGIFVTIFYLYGYNILDKNLSFFISSGIIALRLILHLLEKVGSLREMETPTTRIVILIIDYIIIIFAFVMLFNLIFDFRLWYIIGVAGRWIEEIVISINIILFSLIGLGIYTIYIQREAMKKGVPTENVLSLVVNVIILIIVPVVFMVGIMPYLLSIDLSIFGGVLHATTFEGQVVSDWFSYVFYILFQAPIPAIMIAFMTISAVAVIVAQNVGRLGGFMASVAIGAIAIIPLIMIMSVFTGSVDPPQELIDLVGLERSLASFIYGMGLVVSYTFVVVIIGVFVASSKMMGLQWR